MLFEDECAAILTESGCAGFLFFEGIQCNGSTPGKNATWSVTTTLITEIFQSLKL